MIIVKITIVFWILFCVSHYLCREYAKKDPVHAFLFNINPGAFATWREIITAFLFLISFVCTFASIIWLLFFSGVI